MDNQTNDTQQHESPYLTIPDLARRWHLKTWGIRNKLARGLPLPPSFKFPGCTKRLFRLAEVEIWERKQAIEMPEIQIAAPAKIGRPTKREALRRRQEARGGA